MRRVHARAPARGAALLVVVWLIALLAATIGAFAAVARVEHVQGRVLNRGVVADQVARAGLEYAMTRVVEFDPRRQWVADGRPYTWRFADAEVEVVVVDESGKIDLNGADATLLTSMFTVAGVERAEAARLASAVMDWRDSDPLSQPEGGAEDPDYEAAERPYGAKDAPFETIAELQLVLGVTQAVYDRLAPHITVYSGQGRPNEQFAGALVLQAMGMDAERVIAERRRPRLPGENPLVGAGTGTYSIDSRARLRDGRSSVLRAVVRVGNSGLPGSSYTPLRWEEGALAR